MSWYYRITICCWFREKYLILPLKVWWRRRSGYRLDETCCYVQATFFKDYFEVRSLESISGITYMVQEEIAMKVCLPNRNNLSSYIKKSFGSQTRSLLNELTANNRLSSNLRNKLSLLFLIPLLALTICKTPSHSWFRNLYYTKQSFYLASTFKLCIWNLTSYQ
jgi:hypothetical protein